MTLCAQTQSSLPVIVLEIRSLLAQFQVLCEMSRFGLHITCLFSLLFFRLNNGQLSKNVSKGGRSKTIVLRETQRKRWETSRQEENADHGQDTAPNIMCTLTVDVTHMVYDDVPCGRRHLATK